MNIKIREEKLVNIDKHFLKIKELERLQKLQGERRRELSSVVKRCVFRVKPTLNKEK